MTLQDKQKEILELFDRQFSEFEKSVHFVITDNIKTFILASLSEIAEATKEAIVPKEQETSHPVTQASVSYEAGFNSAIDEMNNRFKEFIK